MQENGDYLNLTEASRLLGVPLYTMSRLASRGALRVFVSPLDRRDRLVRVTDVEALRRIEPVAVAARPTALDAKSGMVG